jgi:hypothetical protein
MCAAVFFQYRYAIDQLEQKKEFDLVEKHYVTTNRNNHETFGFMVVLCDNTLSYEAIASLSLESISPESAKNNRTSIRGFSPHCTWA